MTKTASSTPPEERLIKMWRRHSGSPMGRRYFNLLFSLMVPYSGTIRSNIEEIEPGRARVTLKDRRIVRNHLRSIHAIALANVGELCSGLAMIAALPANTRAIVTHIDIDYRKKARGTLSAIGRATPPEQITRSTTEIATANIIDSEGDTVATLQAHWLLSPR